MRRTPKINSLQAHKQPTDCRPPGEPRGWEAAAGTQLYAAALLYGAQLASTSFVLCEGRASCLIPRQLLTSLGFSHFIKQPVAEWLHGIRTLRPNEQHCTSCNITPLGSFWKQAVPYLLVFAPRQLCEPSPLGHFTAEQTMLRHVEQNCLIVYPKQLPELL